MISTRESTDCAQDTEEHGGRVTHITESQKARLRLVAGDLNSKSEPSRSRKVHVLHLFLWVILILYASAGTTSVDDRVGSSAHDNSAQPVSLPNSTKSDSPVTVEAGIAQDNLNSPKIVSLIKDLDLLLPLKNFNLPESERLYPGVKREYRNGTHEGVDLYCPYGTPVYASADGSITWLDSGYDEYSKGFRDRLLVESRAIGATPEDALWLLKGRKIVVSHGVTQGYRISTTYAHLSEIAPELRLGSAVQKGQLIGFVGNSGTSDGVRASKDGAHLHYEVRIDDRSGCYPLGEGLHPQDSKALYFQVFGDRNVSK